MILKQFSSWLYGIVLTASLIGCVKTLPNGGLYKSIPRGALKYPIEVKFEGDDVPAPYETIREVSVSKERILTAVDAPTTGRMLYRGLTDEEKEMLVARLVIEAQQVGAAALINVKYQYSTSQDKEISTMKGLAIRYTTPPVPR
jgi:uncharacterized protein YbjQ (UPF0145 family)